MIASIANRTTATATATPCLEIIAGANTAYRLLEVGITIVAATASIFGLGIPAAKGVGATSPVTVLSEDQNNSSTFNTTTALAWGTTAPTVPTNFFRRAALPAVIGAGIIWTFPRGIIIPKNTSIVLWNPSAGSNSAADVWCVVDE